MLSIKQQKGISLLFVVLIMGVILSIGLGISSILVQQTRITGEIGYSVVAFYAADSGIEQELYDLYKLEEGEHPPQYTGDLGDASYEVIASCGADVLPENCPANLSIDDDCDALNCCIKSVGIYQGTKRTKRAIKIEY